MDDWEEIESFILIRSKNSTKSLFKIYSDLLFLIKKNINKMFKILSQDYNNNFYRVLLDGSTLNFVLTEQGPQLASSVFPK